MADVETAGDVRKTLTRLHRLFLDGVLDDCHHLAHRLGHVFYERSEDLGRALEAGTEACIDGYYHGVVEAAVAGGMSHEDHGAEHGALSDVDPNQTCRPVAGDEELYAVCVHGLGHGLFQASGNDLTATLRACGALDEQDDTDHCEGGALMENTMQFMHLAPEEFLLEAPQACDGYRLDEYSLESCYEQIGEVSMFYFGHILEPGLEVCNAIDDEYGRDQCVSGAEAEIELVEEMREAAGNKS